MGLFLFRWPTGSTGPGAKFKFRTAVPSRSGLPALCIQWLRTVKDFVETSTCRELLPVSRLLVSPGHLGCRLPWKLWYTIELDRFCDSLGDFDCIWFADDPELQTYDSRLRRLDGAQVVRIRWYGPRSNKPDHQVWLERKVHREPWTRERSYKVGSRCGQLGCQHKVYPPAS